VAEHIELNRTFWPVEADKEHDPEAIRIMAALGVDRQVSWNKLLEKPRIVILGEPGTGKTEELSAIAKRLRNDGNSAFFCRIELLQDLDLRQSFDIGTSVEFDEWLTGDKEGYFFLDSVEEARLKRRSAFEIALRRFANAMGKGLNRATVVVSCRVSDWQATADLSIFLTHLPEPSKPENVVIPESDEIPTEEAEQAAEGFVLDDEPKGSEGKKEHIVFQLAPLNEQQIHRFAVEKGVHNPSDFIKAIERADAMIFAERPQDLLELIQFWNSNGRLGGHAEILYFNIQIKLAEHDPDRDRQRPLSAHDALLGAERLAAAITLQKKNAIMLPDRPIDAGLREVSIEPKEALPDWSSDKIQTLLDRAIFDEAIYGTVRFHHRSVREYLTASWLKRLLDEGKSRRSIEDLLFANRYGRDVVIPSMRPIAAWVAIWDERVRNRLCMVAPEVLIENGDPSALPVEFRKALLIGFTELYANRQYTGTSFDITMIRRLADPQLAPTINDLLEKFAKHEDVCALLLKLVWQGQISESVDAALPFAMDDQARPYIKICAIRAVAVAGTSDQHSNLVNALLADMAEHDLDVLGEICEAFFPTALSVHQLLTILEIFKESKTYSSSPIQRIMEEITKAPLLEETAEQLLRGLHGLLKRQPFIERRHCEISARHAWLLPIATKIANQFIRKKDPLSLDPIVLDLFLCFFAADHYRDFTASEREEILKDAKVWPEFRLQLFWHAIAAARAREVDGKKHITAWWQVRWEIGNFWVPKADDLERLFEDMRHQPLMDDRAVALTAIFTVYVDGKRPQQLREQMKRGVTGTPQLEAKLYELLHPKPLTDENKKWLRQERYFKRRREANEKRQKALRQDWQQKLKQKPAEIKNVGSVQKGEIWQRTVYLYDRIREKRDKNTARWGYSDWKVLIDEFGYEVARNFRDGCVSYWRGYDPFGYPNRRSDNSVPWPRIIGLTGLAMEAAGDPQWAKNLSHDEALIAAHYSICELNGFPTWLTVLLKEFPEIVGETIKDEVSWELHEGPAEKSFPHTLSALRYGDQEIRKRYKGILFDLLSAYEPTNDKVLEDVLSMILEENYDVTFLQRVAELASERFEAAPNNNRKYMWVIVLLCADGGRGCELLKGWIAGLPSIEEQKETMINFCAALMDHRNSRFGRAARDFERVEVLNDLLPLIYKFIRVEEGARHEGGVYTPGTRDHAEGTRSHLLGVIVNTPGRQSYDALVNLANSISFGYSKDRMDYLAKERAALDAELEPWSGAAVAEFAVWAEKQPKSEADLFALGLARLDDLKKDIEEGDESIATLLLKVTNEPELRRYFADQLRKSSRAFYTVGSEEELADATRTDIRLNAPQVSAPVPIELKIADKWTLAQLIERLENQLVGQYMRVSQYGIFLVVHNGKKKSWKDTRAKKLLGFAELIETLKRDLTHLTPKYPNIAALEVIGIDFTARSMDRSTGSAS
jgi:hypothetical protein